jgi:hypothetical protein
MTVNLRRVRNIVVVALVVCAPSIARAQDSTSAPVAAELVKMLDEMKIDSVAAAEPDGFFVGALYLPGSQLLVVRGKFQFSDRPAVLIDRKLYRDVYIDLNSAALPDGKIFVSDLEANGVRFRGEKNQPFDTVDMSGKNYSFDGDWGKAKLSKDEYTAAYTAADQAYTRMLQALVAQLKKSS